MADVCRKGAATVRCAQVVQGDHRESLTQQQLVKQSGRSLPGVGYQLSRGPAVYVNHQRYFCGYWTGRQKQLAIQRAAILRFNLEKLGRDQAVSRNAV